MTRLRLQWAAAVVVAALGFNLFAAPPAVACDISTHCYGLVYTAPAGVDGVYSVVRPACIGAPAGNFATDEVWLASSDAKYWVETGFIMNFANINGLPQGLLGFWFDSRPGGGMHGHVLESNPALGVDTTAWILNTAANTYYVIFGPSNNYTGYSTNNSMTPGVVEVGSEITNSTGESYSWFSSMQDHYAGSWSYLAPPIANIVNAPQV